MIQAHIRMTEPWPKITALLGAVIAMFFLEVPVFPVLVAFVVGLYVSNGAYQKVPLFRLLLGAVAVGCAVGFLAWTGAAQMHHASMGSYWHSFSDDIIAAVRQNVKLTMLDTEEKWDVLRQVLYYQGPLIYLSMLLFSCWASLGLAAHMRWWNEKHPYSANGLRSVEPSKVLSIAFALFTVGDFYLNGRTLYLWSGVTRLLTVFMFIQGCIALSRVMNGRKVRPAVRAIIYSLFVFIGFYALVGMGWAYPFFSKNLKKKQKATMPLSPSPLEVL
jgi:hypothetical protein